MTRANVILREAVAKSLTGFENRVTSGYTLVDKTQALLDFLAVEKPRHLVIRPRRCGKSTALTMFKYANAYSPDLTTTH